MAALGQCKDPRDRFFAKVRKTDTCWLWMGGKDKDGYGKFQLTVSGSRKQIHVRAHQYAYFLKHGRYATPQVLHSCDTPACVNWDHLHEGTQSKNIRDCVLRGRHPRIGPVGELNANHRATAEQVMSWRAAWASGARVCDMARAAGFTYSLVDAAVHRRTWRHLP